MNLDFIMEAGLDQSVWHRLLRHHCSIAGRGKMFGCSPQDDVLAHLVKALHCIRTVADSIPDGVNDCILPATLWP
jgi:hypothetical protein